MKRQKNRPSVSWRPLWQNEKTKEYATFSKVLILPMGFAKIDPVRKRGAVGCAGWFRLREIKRLQK